MRYPFRQLSKLLFFLAMWGPNGLSAQQVTVFAAASLQNVFDEMADIWQKDTGVVVKNAYGASSRLAKQISAGAPADIYVSASQDWMRWLRTSGQFGAMRDMVGNHLVLITLQDAPFVPGLEQPDALMDYVQKERLAIPLVTAVPAGQYGKAALENLGLWHALSAHLAQTDNVRGALALVALGQSALGIVYASDAHIEERVRVVSHFPEAVVPKIRYPAALLNQNNQAAADYLEFLFSCRAASLFSHFGFVPLVSCSN